VGLAIADLVVEAGDFSELLNGADASILLFNLS